VEELSKGMAQKIQFITTVLHNPKLLILDEPFSGFDPINVNLIKDEILRMKDEGCSIILSTHNMESVEELCDEIALINKAKLVISGSVDKIRSEYGHNRVEILFSGAVGEAVAEAENQAPKDVEGLFTVLSTEKVKDEFRSVLELAPGVTHNDVMSALIKQVNLDSYQKLMPKMSEIFIKLVGESGGATSQSIDDYRKAHGGK
ncbi:MAG: DUF4162 domain-containing protein, partial [Bacteroidales bacterium]|nr:DUF4162 domain-containing protein [Bacteroidales bacterium]